MQEEDYADVRVELQHISCNLTSVNVNPRESVFDELLEDFWEDVGMQGLFGGSASSSATPSSHGGSSHSVMDHSSMSVLAGDTPMPMYSSSGVKNLRKHFARYEAIQQQSSSASQQRKLESEGQKKMGVSSLGSYGLSGSNGAVVDVPEVYFDSKFTLESPSSFEQTIHPKDRECEAQLSRLNMYLDYVEYSLLNQIWTRSDAIFSALDDIKGQKFHVSQALMKLINLRTQLKVLDKRISVSAIHIPQMHRRKANEMMLYAKLSSMQQVIQGLSAIRSLIEVGDFLGAFEFISESKDLYTTELQEIKSMANTGKQLDVYDALVTEVISNKFVSLAIQWEESDNDSINSSSMGLSESTELRKLAQALLRIDRLPPAFGMYKSRLINSLRQIVRTCVREFLVDFDPTNSLAVSEDKEDDVQEGRFSGQVHAMSAGQFLSCLLMCFENLLKAITRAQKVHQFIISSLSEGSDDGNKIEVTLLDSTQTLSQTCLVSACDVAQRALAQLLSMKKGDLARITLEKMKELWVTAMQFIVEVERVADTSAYIIRQALHAQTSMFLQHIHERNKLRIISTMDHEKWVQCDVPVEIQRDFERLVAGRAMSEKTSTGFQQPSSHSGVSTNIVVIEGLQYKVVWSVLELSSTIMSYLDIAVCFSSVTGDVINMIKDLIQLFNKSANMLVLGSGAQKSLAQLRSISAKHLTATAQSLAVLLAILPHVRTALLTQLPSNRSMLLLELDRVSQDLHEHHGSILSKFVAIVSDSMDSALPKLRSMDWDKTGGERCEYFELLSKNLEALHRVLITDATLPLEQAQDVFSRVFALLQRKLPKHFESTTPATKAGRQRVLDEIGHLGNALALLRFLNSSELVKSLETHFSTKYDTV